MNQGSVELSEVWGNSQLIFRKSFGSAVYDSWIAPLSPYSFDDVGVVTIIAPNRFMSDWVTANFGDEIQRILEKIIPSMRKVVFVDRKSIPSIQDEALDEERQKTIASTDNPDNVKTKGNNSKNDAQSTFVAKTDSPVLPDNPPTTTRAPAPLGDKGLAERLEALTWSSLDPRYTFQQFIVGKPNELGHAAARRVAESRVSPFNPLFLYGGVGLGKTHLMHAIAWNIKGELPEQRCIYISAEQFMYEFVRSLRFKDTFAFKELFRSVDILMIDDVQFIAGKDSTQEEFFHTFNALADQHKQIVISADRSPSDLEGVEERLRSRLGWGLVVDIHPTDYELRLGILQSKMDMLAIERPDVKIEPATLEFLAQRIVSNVRILEGALNRLIAYGSLVGRVVSVDAARQELQDILRSSERKVTIDEIQRKVAKYYGIRYADMISPRKSRNVARPRQIAMYLAKELTTRSLPEIGRKFDGRDHTTVLHAVRKITDLLRSDSRLEEDLEMIRRELDS